MLRLNHTNPLLCLDISTPGLFIIICQRAVPCFAFLRVHNCPNSPPAVGRSSLCSSRELGVAVFQVKDQLQTSGEAGKTVSWLSVIRLVYVIMFYGVNDSADAVAHIFHFPVIGWF